MRFQQNKRMFRILRRLLQQSDLDMIQLGSLMLTNGSSRPHVHREASYRIYTGINQRPPLGYTVSLMKLIT